jgi:hypothetical protein
LCAALLQSADRIGKAVGYADPAHFEALVAQRHSQLRELGVLVQRWAASEQGARELRVLLASAAASEQDMLARLRAARDSAAEALSKLEAAQTNIQRLAEAYR